MRLALLSLRFRITLSIVLLVAVGMYLILWQALDHSLLDHKEQERHQQVLIFGLLTDMAERDLLLGDYEELRQHVDVLMSDSHILSVVVTKPDGERVVDTRVNTHDDHNHSHHSLVPEGVRRAAIVHSGEHLGDLEVSYSNAHAETAFTRARDFGTAVYTIGLLLLVGLGLFISSILTHRLVRLNRVVRAFADGDRSIRSHFSPDDEIGRLGATFDNLADVIDRQIVDLEQAENEVERNLEVQSAIADILQIAQRRISLHLQMEQILGRVLALPWGNSKRAGGKIFVYEVNTRELVLYAQHGLSEIHRELCNRVDLGHCFCGEAATSERICFTPGIAATLDNEVLGIADHAHYAVPILADDELLGVISLYFPPGYPHSSDDERLLEGVANTLAGVIKRRQADDQIRILSQAMEQSPASIVITGIDGRIEYVNSKFTVATGYSFDEVRGRNPNILKSGELPNGDYQHMWQTIKAGMEWCGEFHNRRKSGELFWEYASISGIRDEDGEIAHFVAVKEDITERKESEALIHNLAYYDGLTGLPNRTSICKILGSTLDEAKASGQSFGLLLLDINNFREINGTLGHENGDRILKESAARISNALVRLGNEGHWQRSELARLGGDEFAILLVPIEDHNTPTRLAKEILLAMEIPYLLNDLALDISPSIGICIYPEHGTNPDLLMQRADMAMSAAKGANLGVATFKPEYDRYSPRRLAMMGELRKAIRDNDLTLFYQPKIEIASGRAVAVEALVRWTHPGFGKIPPNEFIPMAERTGMIKPLTQWVINQALGQCASWLNKGITLDMAINLSAWDLGDIRLPERIGQMLEAWGLESRCLVLEITETAVMADPELSSTILGQLDEMGVRISVDDYGTGYSSLAYIKRLPLEELKIDQSFVHDMASAEYDATIVRSTVALAHNLGLSVVAEGVEDLETLQLLESLGCDKVQGYYLSRPLPANDLEEWYRECHAEPAGE